MISMIALKTVVIPISGMMNFMFYAAILLAALWFWMRFYIYLVMIRPRPYA